MEQDNKTMSAEELIRYIEDNNLELQMLDILLFNDCGFYFTPIYKPRINSHGSMMYSLIDYGDVNILCTKCQLPSFRLSDEMLPKKWNRYMNHPEHLHAYLFRYNNTVKGEFIYSRCSSVTTQIRNDAFEDFIEYSGLSNIKDFNRLARKAARRRNKQDFHTLTYMEQVKIVNEYTNYVDLLLDEQVLKSIVHSNEDVDKIIKLYSEHFVDIEKAIYLNRYISLHGSLLFSDNMDTTESGFSFYVEYVPITEWKTSIERDFTIVDADDHIPDILYGIAVKIGANVFYAATGYTYESGIQMLMPAMAYMVCMGEIDMPYNIELMIGDLQNYRPSIKQQSLNRKTAEKINWMIDSSMLDHLYTCPDAFYHGKFYYISNGRISYVIVGSSNITESAYTKNRELDVMFRFERGEDGQPCEQEQMFLDWYADLKKKCVEIPRLDETLFSSNLLIDEAGNSSSSSILKKLTSEEEKERYRFLESLCPSSVDEKMFYKKKEFKAFKGYIAFYYPENNITVLESFQYGNSCFVFGTTDEERIRMALARKSKEQVKQSDIYISNVNHDEDYQSELRQIFGK